MKTGAGQSVALNLSKNRDGLLIKKLDVADAVSKASLSIDIQETIKRLSFNGKLDTYTAASLISTPQVQGGMVQGEITIEFGDQNALGIMAQGRLRGIRFSCRGKRRCSSELMHWTSARTGGVLWSTLPG